MTGGPGELRSQRLSLGSDTCQGCRAAQSTALSKGSRGRYDEWTPCGKHRVTAEDLGFGPFLCAFFPFAYRYLLSVYGDRVRRDGGQWALGGSAQ